MNRARLLSTFLLVSALALAGCSDDDNPTVPNPVTSQSDADDVALLAGISFDNVNTVFRAGAQAGAPVPVDAVVLADTTFQRGSVTFVLSRRYFNSAHVEQSAPDAATDSVVVGSRASGTDSTSSARYRVTLGHAGQLRAGGLIALRPTVTLEGAWADTLDARFTALRVAETRTFYSRVLTVANGIRIPKSTSDVYPTAGQIVWTVHAERTRNGNRGDVEKTLDAVVTLTFNGTRFPVLTVNGAWSYALDLVTGTVSYAGSV
jgi:hypothetical protein